MPETDPNLAAIKQREQNARDAIRRGEREVDVGSFGAGQLGLSFAMCDEFGRIWRDAGDGKIVLVFSPHHLPRQPRGPIDVHGRPTTLEKMDAAMGYKPEVSDGRTAG